MEKIKLKSCIECLTLQRLANYYRHPQMGDGHLNKCKDCCRLYSVWKLMLKRCYDKKSKDYPRYGGRGIRVCEGWRYSHKPFTKWMHENGWKQGLQIDRVDNDGGYKPFNCQVITAKENMRKSSTTKLSAGQVSLIKKRFKDKLYKRYLVAAEFGVSPQTISDIKHGRTWKDIEPCNLPF